ncbi:MAG: BatD family protein, partial [Cytophagales bacterium]|nr:BatD family protein [Cytophagales bacterium]
MFAQRNFRIVAGKNRVAKNEYFTLQLVSENRPVRRYTPFPNLEGFEKAGTSSSSSTRIVQGQISSTHQLIQNYVPLAEGNFTIAPFVLQVDGEEVSFPGMQLVVTAPIRTQNKPFFPYDFFGLRSSGPQVYDEVDDEAFLSLSTNKSSVYVGEGFTLSLAFYVARTNQAPLQFYDVSDQLRQVIKTFKPKKCWEENFQIQDIRPESVQLSGKAYDRYLMYQASFFPLTQEDIFIPPVAMK